MEAESSRAARHKAKRPAVPSESDDEDGESSPPPQPKGKRRKWSTPDVEDGDLDILVDDDIKPNLSSRDQKEAAHGHDDEDDEEGGKEVLEDENGLARPIGFRPEYQRGSDGRVS